MPLIPTQEPPYYQISDSPDTGGVKQYIALLNQSTTDPPEATILKNTLGGTPVWTYSAVGNYILTLTGAFTLNKTSIILSNTSGSIVLYDAGDQDGIGNQIYIQTYLQNPATKLFEPGEQLLYNTPIEITVYP